MTHRYRAAVSRQITFVHKDVQHTTHFTPLPHQFARTLRVTLPVRTDFTNSRLGFLQPTKLPSTARPLLSRILTRVHPKPRSQPFLNKSYSRPPLFPRKRFTMSNVPSRTATPSRDTGSHTIQQTQPNPVLRLSAPSGVLRLRAEPEERRHIQWAEDVVDNEGMGKKSSKGTAPASLRVGSSEKTSLTLDSVLHIPRAPRSRRVQRRVLERQFQRRRVG